MLGLGKLFNRAIGLERQYGPVTVRDFPLYRQVCRHGEFWQHRVQLHTPFATFFNVEFANRIADCAICANCGYMHWFMPTQLAPTPSDAAGDSA